MPRKKDRDGEPPERPSSTPLLSSASDLGEALKVGYGGCQARGAVDENRREAQQHQHQHQHQHRHQHQHQQKQQQRVRVNAYLESSEDDGAVRRRARGAASRDGAAVRARG
jgi:hypothetical protein